MRPTSILATSVVIMMVAAGILAGLAAHFHWGMPAIGALSGTAGLAGVITVALMCRQSHSKPQRLRLSPDLLVVDQLHKSLATACQEAIQKVHGPSKFTKICFVTSVCTGADTYFHPHDGQIKNFRFEDHPNGSVLVVRLAEDNISSERIMKNDHFKGCVAYQGERLQDFVDRGHQHIALSYAEYRELLIKQRFPKRLCQLITSH